MSELKRILIVGTGLIGGSLCLSIKKDHPDVLIVGLDQQEESLKAALAVGAINQIGCSFATEAVLSDVIILCTPVKQTIRYLADLEQLPLTKPLIVSDVGSTKVEIMTAAAELTNPQICFIGGHPMAGSHKSGFVAADVDLFENAYYIFTPSDNCNPKALAQFQALLSGTRGKFLTLSAHEHDEITGIVSHLPHIIASGLVKHNQQVVDRLPLTKQLAAGGFRDITRIASSDPAMWTDILLSNQTVLINHMDDWQKQMSIIKEWLVNQDKQEIFRFFSEAKDSRDALPQRKPGAIPAFNDLFVELPDYAGEIAAITGILAEAELSLTNLKILENREDIFGTLQLTFKHNKDVTIAKALLEEKGEYTCYEK